MLYHLLVPLREQFSWLNVFQYITFRAMLAFLFTFLFVLFLQPYFIHWLSRRGLKGQPIRSDGPREHALKQGTPTMGGVVMVAGVALATLLLTDLSNPYVWLVLVVLLSYAAIGVVDDWRKITMQDCAGLSGPAKLMWQGGIALVVGLFLVYLINFAPTLALPFLKEQVFDLGMLFVLLLMVVVVGTSNAVNLTDGLDGLAIGPVMTVASLYALFTYVAGHKELADHLLIPYVAGSGDLTIILSAVVAAGLGFLWYNTFPAQVFMGDSGALALGGVLGIVAVLAKQELLLVVAGGVFVVEALSVIIQRYHYKLTGRRVFRMAPIHHHFELKGWAEPKIIVRFWIVSIVLALLSLTSLKLR